MVLRNRSNNVPIERTARLTNSFVHTPSNHGILLMRKLKPNLPFDSFKKYINNFIRPLGKSLFGISDRFGLSDRFGIKIPTKMRVDFSDLREHHDFNTLFVAVVLMTKHQHVISYAF